MPRKHSHWIEGREDGGLAVHKVELGPPEIALVIVLLSYSIVLAGMLFSGPFIAKVPMSWSMFALCWLAGLGTLAAGLRLAAFLYSRATRGTWLIGTDAIVLRPLRGPERRINWTDVRWVRWGQLQFVLRGDVCHIGLGRGFLADSDWKEVRERVESLLAGRFDLTIRPLPNQEFRWSRVLRVAVPLGLFTVLLLRTLPSLSARLAAVVLLVYMAVMMGTTILCFRLSKREYERLNPTWRAAKSKVGDWDDWSF
jgi:hypothetical protein